MSPQDVFASQMWPWPDPAIKRDSMGRVLFMNAAFLQLYGGRIEDWQGNVISGWPTPQPPGIPYRFETRVPLEGKENVYDWIEYTLADGSAMALARDVTHLQAPIDPLPGDIAPPPEQAPQNEDSFQAAPQMAAAAVSASLAHNSGVAVSSESNMAAEQAPMDNTAPLIDVPDISVPELEVPDLNLEAAYEPTGHDAAQDIAAMQAQPLEMASVPVEDAPAAELTSEPAQEYSQVPEAPVIAEAETQLSNERAYERRALPIEDDSAVLGNNWRDAVIAKAVGAEQEVNSDEQVDEVPVQTTDPSQAGEGPIRILLAEDNAINALLTRTLLEAEGHVVETVEDGLLAVEAMKTSSYDLIFMDMRMPNMDGLEATRKIRAMSNVSKGLPIIALTANAFDDDRNACFDSGMNDFMTKPVSAEELSEMVKTWTKNLAERNAA